MTNIIKEYEYSEFIDKIHEYYDFSNDEVSIYIQNNGSITIENTITKMQISYYLRNANKSLLQVEEQLKKILGDKVQVRIGVMMCEELYDFCVNYPNVEPDYYQEIGFLDKSGKITDQGLNCIKAYRAASEKIFDGID